MNIITSIPRYSDGEVDDAFMREIKLGFEMERRTEQERENKSAKRANQLKGTTHPVLGKPVASIPARDFFRLVNKYGHDEVHSKKFVQYFNKKIPELSPNKA
jgi:hypothetical protein